MAHARKRARIILDTDPSVDDVFAILATLSLPEEIELLLISITHGNVDAINCLRNAVTLFNIVDKNNQWRLRSGKSQTIKTSSESKPILALGAEQPIMAAKELAEYYHGRDGLGGTHTSHPHTTPPDNWRDIFNATSSTGGDQLATNFHPTAIPAHKEMLRILRENPPNQVTIVAIGPLTNLALAAQEDCQTFLRAKEVVIMGCAVNVPGNVTPVAEFNTFADPHAADLIFSLTNPNTADLAADSQAELVSSGLKVTLIPLDLTTLHLLRKSHILPIISRLREEGSPLAEWVGGILGHTFKRAGGLLGASENDDLGLAMHDPLCIWYVLGQVLNEGGWKYSGSSPENIRVESEGKWTRGMCVLDRRGRPTAEGPQNGDRHGWLNTLQANQIWRITETPGVEVFPEWIVRTIFGKDIEPDADK